MWINKLLNSEPTVKKKNSICWFIENEYYSYDRLTVQITYQANVFLFQPLTCDELLLFFVLNTN